MDLPTIVAQIATTAQIAGPAAAEFATRTGEAGVFTKIMTDLARGLWGGKVEIDPPKWFPILCACVFGVIGMVLVALMLGFDVTQPHVAGAAAFTGVTAAGGTSALVTNMHNATRYTPPPPAAPRLNETCPTCGQPMGGAPWTGSPGQAPSSSAPSPSPASGSSPSPAGPAGGKG